MTKERLHQLLGYTIFMYAMVFFIGAFASGGYASGEYSSFWKLIHLLLFMECSPATAVAFDLTGNVLFCVDNNVHIQFFVFVLLIATRYLVSKVDEEKH